MFEDQINTYLAETMSPYMPKLKTPVKTLNNFLEKALGDLHNAPYGVGSIAPYVSDMVTKNGKKRLKKIFERYEETCEEMGIENFIQFRCLYYVLAIIVKQLKKSLLPTNDDQLT